MRLKPIRPGDIVEVDVRRWRAHCRVVGRTHEGLEVRALPGLRFPWRQVKTRQVVGHWACRAARRAPAGDGAAPVRSVQEERAMLQQATRGRVSR